MVNARFELWDICANFSVTYSAPNLKGGFGGQGGTWILRWRNDDMVV